MYLKWRKITTSDHVIMLDSQINAYRNHPGRDLQEHCQCLASLHLPGGLLALKDHAGGFQSPACIVVETLVLAIWSQEFRKNQPWLEWHLKTSRRGLEAMKSCWLWSCVQDAFRWGYAGHLADLDREFHVKSSAFLEKDIWWTMNQSRHTIDMTRHAKSKLSDEW